MDANTKKKWTLSYDDGTLVVEGAQLEELPNGFRFDSRIGALRGPAFLYGDVIILSRWN